ncbi:DoxX family protein [Nocardioides panzhihuensis]|uniref:Putative oxidoreductase n=1 Tax=Nocardioides panzhihuensis TaxID=860243 RepID=A0A7Z0DR41_9ACTN|nr:DoxX family protein [Nocardioides panzhihuensis]NYI79824.1 putative oxidoreductase [Nocardioides panzhihuensis]
MSRRVGRNAYTGLFNDVVLLAARVVVGGIFVAHGWQKYDQGFAGTEQFLGGLGVPQPAIAAQVATYVELVGGALLMLGLFAPVVGVLLAAQMAGAIWYAHRTTEVFVDQGGWELAAALGVSALVLGLVAPGRFTLDQLLTWPFKARAAKRKAREAEANEAAEAQPYVEEKVTIKA